MKNHQDTIKRKTNLCLTPRQIKNLGGVSVEGKSGAVIFPSIYYPIKKTK